MTDRIVSYGLSIISPSDLLQKVKVDYLYHSIRSPKPNIAALIRQLRIVKNLDPRRYMELKKQLPYFVCGSFNPSFRRSDNFAFTQFFVLDIDHISSGGMETGDLRKRLESDRRVLFSFLSPGEDGLKLMFQLKDRCWDAGVYSLFYKSFARSFSKEYNLDEVMDYRTSDVCRACFISVDPDAFYNPDSEAVDINEYVNLQDISAMFDLKRELEKEQDTKDKVDDKKDVGSDPDKETMDIIRQLLQGKLKQSIAQDINVPQELNLIIDDLSNELQENGLVVTLIRNIQYGKNIQIQLGLKKAEINVFYGKRGFTVVECPRTGTNAELNHLCSDIIRTFLSSKT